MLVCAGIVWRKVARMTNSFIMVSLSNQHMLKAARITP